MKHELTDRSSICHSTSGRLRIKTPAVRSPMVNARALEELLAHRPGIRSADVRSRTGSVIIRYDGDAMTPQTVVDALREVLKSPSVLLSPGKEKTSPNEADIRAIDQGSPFTGLLKVIALTGFMIYYLGRTYILKSPLNPLWIALATVVGSLPLFRRAFTDTAHGRLMSVHVFLSSGSVLALITGQPGAALEVAWIREVGQLLEDYVQDRSRRQIRETLMVSRHNAFLLIEGAEIEIPVERIRSGDTVIVHAPERIPVDGRIVEGEALIDESHITGRAEPEHRKPGDSVKAGTIVHVGNVQVRAEHVGEDTYTARIVSRVEESLANRAEVEKRADLLAARLTAVGLVSTAFTAMITRDPGKTLSVLLAMTSPCATVLAASTAVTAALANAARNKVLVKGGLYLERFGEIDCVCFDKTGTITSDVPSLVQILPASTGTETLEILGLAADAQTHNPHPIARSLVQAAISQGHIVRKPERTDVVLGRGVIALVNCNTITIGNAHLMKEKGIDISTLADEAKRLEQVGHTNVYVAKDGTAVGLIAMAYGAKPGLSALLSKLKADGVKQIHLVSGDENRVVETIAQSHGFDGYEGNLLPDRKADYVETLTASGLKVAMVGDGINDALALSRARIGVAMGAGGTEAAIEAADIALVDSDLWRLIHLRGLSGHTLNVIEQNHWFAITTDFFGAVLGMLGHISPMMSGFSHVLHTIVISMNSSRVLSWTSEELPRSEI